MLSVITELPGSCMFTIAVLYGSYLKDSHRLENTKTITLPPVFIAQNHTCMDLDKETCLFSDPPVQINPVLVDFKCCLLSLSANNLCYFKVQSTLSHSDV